MSNSGNLELAIESYHRASAWRSPLNSYAHNAATEFFNLLEENTYFTSDPIRQIDGLRRLRSALLSSRSFVFPSNSEATDNDLLAKINLKLASLLPQEKHLRKIRYREVSYTLQFLCGIFFIAWLISAVATLWFGFTPKGRLKRRAFFMGSCSCSLCLIAWLILLRLA